MAKARDSNTRLARYCRALSLSFVQLAQQLGVTPATATRYCLPKDQPDHRRPGDAPSERLKALSCGLIHAGNYADLITEAEADAMMAEYAVRKAAADAGEVARG